MPPPPATDDLDAPACPRCGYDLRGTPLGGRCPECGLVLDADARARAGVPWDARRQLGPARAAALTALRAIATPGRLARAASVGVDGRAAARFARGANLLAALVLAGLAGTLVAALRGPLGGMGAAAWAGAGPTFLTAWWGDLAWPLAAGAWLWPTLPVAAALVPFALADQTRAAVARRAAGAEDGRADRAVPLARYAALPLAAALGALALSVAAMTWRGALGVRDTGGYGDVAANALLVAALVASSVLAAVLPLVAATRLPSRALRAGPLAQLGLAAELAARWLAALALLLVAGPWVVGLTALAWHGG